MTTPSKRRQGFTLIELLTVIAIIGILAGFIAAGLPRALMAAKLAKLDNTFLQIRNILTEYFVDHGTFPPAYGYVSPEARGLDPVVVLLGIRNGDVSEDIVYFLKPWMAYLGQHNNKDLHDNFSIAYDTDRDGDISRLEFSLFGTIEDAASQRFSFPRVRYDPVNVPSVLRIDLEKQRETQDRRPIIYLPINKRQLRKVASVWFDFAETDGFPGNPRPNDDKEPNRTLSQMAFPPPIYDAYVLISVGPSAKTWGMIYEFASPLLDQAEYSPLYYYHVLAMATYFMATRDAEEAGTGDGELDFDFRARTRRGQGKNIDNRLPDPAGANGPGPIIFVGEG